ncbi:integrase, partial [Escherichia coli]
LLMVCEKVLAENVKTEQVGIYIDKRGVESN